MRLPALARWAVLSPLLDELLDLDDEGRRIRLAAHAAADPQLAADLADLLGDSDQAAASGLLAGTAASPLFEEPTAGTRIGAYGLEEVLGEGGSGTVWRASRVDGQFEGKVAIKLLHASRLGPTALARFRREAGILARLAQPNIARLFDAGITPGGRPYLILELVEGQHIDVHANAHALTVRERVELFRQVIRAVSHAHSHLAVHRDIKPSNILVDRTGQVKLLDFGIAKLLEEEPTSTENGETTTESGRFLTPAYAAPEQVSGDALTTATDVYALGVVLYKLLSGRHPTLPEGSTPAVAIRSTIEAVPVPLHVAAATAEDGAERLADERRTSPPRLVNELRGDLSSIAGQCLRKSPSDRYTTAAELGEDLRRYLDDEPVKARAGSLLYRSRKLVRRHRVAVAASAAATLLLVAATIVSTVQLLEARHQREAAIEQAARAQASSRFLSFMVGEIGSETAALTPTQVIDRGVYLLDQQREIDSRPMVDQLTQMSIYYARLHESVKELVMIERAQALARKIRYEPGLIIALCQQVDTELTLERRDRAQALLSEAWQHLARLAPPEPSAEVNCESSAAALAESTGDNLGAISHAERALRLLRENNRLDDPLYGGIATRLSLYHDNLGHAREAHEYTRIAGEAMERAGGGGTVDMLTNSINEAADLVNFGQLRQALALTTTLMQRLKARGVGVAAGVALSANHDAILAAVGRYDDALQVLDQTIIDAANTNNPMWQQRALFFRARTLTRGGRLPEAARALDEIERIYLVDAEKNKDHLQFVTLTRAEWLLKSGNAGAADAVMQRLLAEMGYPAKTSSWQLRGALPVAARIALTRHEPARAQAYAEAAVTASRVSALDARLSADLGRALVLLGAAQRANGLVQTGTQSIQDAVPSLEGGLGPEHAEVREAKSLVTEPLPTAASAPR